MKIKRFADIKDGEKATLEHYIEDEKGNKIKATDDQIQAVWFKWAVYTNGVNAYEEDKYFVYEFSKPIEFDLQKKYNFN